MSLFDLSLQEAYYVQSLVETNCRQANSLIHRYLRKQYFSRYDNNNSYNSSYISQSYSVDINDLYIQDQIDLYYPPYTLILKYECNWHNMDQFMEFLEKHSDKGFYDLDIPTTSKHPAILYAYWCAVRRYFVSLLCDNDHFVFKNVENLPMHPYK